jgi:hypothetical protein
MFVVIVTKCFFFFFLCGQKKTEEVMRRIQRNAREDEALIAAVYPRCTRNMKFPPALANPGGFSSASATFGYFFSFFFLFFPLKKTRPDIIPRPHPSHTPGPGAPQPTCCSTTIAVARVGSVLPEMNLRPRNNTSSDGDVM